MQNLQIHMGLGYICSVYVSIYLIGINLGSKLHSALERFSLQIYDFRKVSLYQYKQCLILSFCIPDIDL